MHAGSYYKRVLLFLVAVVLPSSVLVVLTGHMIGQQQELREKRLADERRRAAREIGQKLLVRLEDVKLHEVSTTASGAQSLNTLVYTSREVRLTALADGERVWLPWEADQGRDSGDHIPSEAAFAEKIRRAEEEEFARGRLAQASVLYHECIEEAESPPQQAYARLSRARVLAKLNQAEESLAEYRAVLSVPLEIIDEHGVPLCLYAAGHLLTRDDSLDKIMQLIARELDAPRWLPPAESYMLRDLVDRLVGSAPGSGLRQQAVEDCRRRIQERIGRLEQALALREDFPLTLKVRLKSPEEEPEPVWVPFGDEPWLVGLAPAWPGGRRLVIAVRGAAILEAVAADAPHAEPLLENVQFTTSTGLRTESLGPSFPGLRLAFPTDGADSRAARWGRQSSFYLIALFLVLCATLSGAYFLWSDVARELRMAEMRSQFIASVSHELKTPLTAIRMFAETLRLGRPEDPQARAEYLDTIVHESHRLTRLLDNVLDFSKIEKGKRTYRREPACLSEIVRAATQAMQYTLTQQDFHLQVHLEDDMPDVPVDRDAIEQAILNLLSNAMKYSGDSRQIDLRLQKKAGCAVIEVSDRGIGIDPSERERIFEKFYRVPSRQNERVPGTGLGLALVFHIVRAHGGRVELQSAIGEGSTFSIYLPLKDKR
jgi:signal transduction histidine kinase